MREKKKSNQQFGSDMQLLDEKLIRAFDGGIDCGFIGTARSHTIPCSPTCNHTPTASKQPDSETERIIVCV